MAATELGYSARFRTQTQLELGLATTISCPVYLNGALVAPSSGTVSVYNGSTVVVDAVAVTVAASIAEYTVPAQTSSPSDGWRVEWSLVLSGNTHRFRNSAALVRRRLYAPCSQVDLFDRVRALDPSGANPITTLTLADFSTYLEDAWVQIENKLQSVGSRPNLIMEPWALREVHLTLTLHLIYANLATRLGDEYREAARDYREAYQDAWSELRFEYDSDEDGSSDGRRRRGAATSAIWLTSHPSRQL